MDAVDEDAIETIEAGVAVATVQHFGVRVQTVAYAVTNFSRTWPPPRRAR
jgi:hypothetical protein